MPLSKLAALTRTASAIWRDKRGTIALMFAVMFLPLQLLTALAVDYSMFVEVNAQMGLAADAAAMHAVRVATNAYQNGFGTVSAEILAGQSAGQQWFLAQLGPIGTVTNANSVVTMNFDNATLTFSAAVSYSGTVSTNIASVILPSWHVSGQVGSIATGSFAEVILMLDNSASMMIGADTSDILALEKASVCTTFNGGSGGRWPDYYAWLYSDWLTIGYGSTSDGDMDSAFVLKAPPSTPINGACDARYTGDPSLCFYMATDIPDLIPNANGSQCKSGGGVSPDWPVPAEPCGFACHSDPNGNDYYGMARSLNPPVKLRLDVVHDAASEIISSLQAAQQAPGQFSVGVYEFNTGLQQVYPAAGGAEAGTDLGSAIADVKALEPPLAPYDGYSGIFVWQANTHFPESAQQLAARLTPAGNGSTASGPTKNIFIVTDGLNEVSNETGFHFGAMTDPSNEQTCQLFKNLGFTVYVLYTTFVPLPDEYYLAWDRKYTEPVASSPILLGLQACASSPATFFQANDSAGIHTAMQAMLKSATSGSARLSY